MSESNAADTAAAATQQAAAAEAGKDEQLAAAAQAAATQNTVAAAETAVAMANQQAANTAAAAAETIRENKEDLSWLKQSVEQTGNSFRNQQDQISQLKQGQEALATAITGIAGMLEKLSIPPSSSPPPKQNEGPVDPQAQKISQNQKENPEPQAKAGKKRRLI